MLREERRQDLEQQEAEPADQAAEVVAGSGEDGVGGVAATEPEIVAAHAMLGFEMADDGLDSGPAAQFALDPGRHPSLLAGEEDPELVIRRRVVAAVSLVSEDARDGVADERLHVRDHGRQRVTVIGIAGQRLHMGDELAALCTDTLAPAHRFRWPPPARASHIPFANPPSSTPLPSILRTMSRMIRP